MSKYDFLFEDFYDELEPDNELLKDSDIEIEGKEYDYKIEVYYPFLPREYDKATTIKIINEITKKLNYLVSNSICFTKVSEVKHEETKFQQFWSFEFNFNQKQFRRFVELTLLIFIKKIPKSSVMIRLIKDDDVYDLSISNVQAIKPNASDKDNYHHGKIRDFCYALVSDRSLRPYYTFMDVYYDIYMISDLKVHIQDPFAGIISQDKLTVNEFCKVDMEPKSIEVYRAGKYSNVFKYDSSDILDHKGYVDEIIEWMNQHTFRIFVSYSATRSFRIYLSFIEPYIIDNEECFVYAIYESTVPSMVDSFAPLYKLLRDLTSESFADHYIGKYHHNKEEVEKFIEEKLCRS